MNQKLEQYLQFFVDHRQKNWPECSTIAKFTVNNKTYSATKVSPFIANYDEKLRMEGDIRRKEKMEKITELVERIKKVQKKVKTTLKKAQEKMKEQADMKKKEAEKQKKGDKIILSIKNLVFKKKLAKKLVD